MIVIKVILIIFTYIFVGIAFLELVLWYDRKTNSKYHLVDYRDETDWTATVMLWPFLLLVSVICIGLPALIKGIRIFFTTVVYLIAAMIDKEKRE